MREMDTNQAWTGYLIVVAAVIAGYYAGVIYRYYRGEFKALWVRVRGKPPAFEGLPKEKAPETYADKDQIPGVPQHQPEAEEPESWQSEKGFQQVEALAGHLKEAIREAHEKHYDKQELLLLLEMTLRDYGYLNGTPFRYAINNLIETECKKYGRIHLEAADLGKVWKVD